MNLLLRSILLVAAVGLGACHRSQSSCFIDRDAMITQAVDIAMPQLGETQRDFARLGQVGKPRVLPRDWSRKFRKEHPDCCILSQFETEEDKERSLTAYSKKRNGSLYYWNSPEYFVEINQRYMTAKNGAYRVEFDGCGSPLEPGYPKSA